KILRNLTSAQRCQFHRSIFWKNQKVTISGIFYPFCELFLILGEILKPIQRIGGGGNFNAAHNSLIQNCMGLLLELSAPISFHGNSATTPGKSRYPRLTQKASSGR